MLVLGLSIESGIASSAANRGLKFAVVTLLVCGLLSSAGGPAAAQQRALGLDVSAWQSYMSQTTWNNIHNVDNRDFVFIRSSRGGTTGEDHRQGGYPSYDNDYFSLSQRYDDPRFVWNITKATNAGMLAGAYHFSRPDVIASTPNSGGIANTGADEADHFIEMAGAWMRPGYLLPVHDLEAGDGVRSDNEMAQFTLDFSDRVHEVMGIRPAIYTNGNYAYYVLGGASPSLRAQVVESYPTLWSARWPNQSNPDSIPIQTGHPKDSYTNIYGPWDDPPNPEHPWSFWQYTSNGYLNSYPNRLDLNVAQGGIEFLKDRLVPALWMNNSSGQWTTLSNWNSGQTPIAPVVKPEQLARYGPLTLPAVRLPGSDDTVILDRSGADITVTLASGTHNIRKLEVRETLNITGGSLAIGYVPSADSTPIAARFSAPVALDGGSLSVHTLQVDAGQTFSLGGTLTLDTIHLMPHSSAPATINLIGDVNFNPLSGAAATIVNGAGTGSSGLIDLGGANRTWQAGDGAAAVDLSVHVPIVNGALTKSGAGTLALAGANSYAGDTTVLEGILRMGNAFLSDSADLYLSTGAMLELDFLSSADVVDSLYIDGVSQAAGIWGADGSGAQFTSPMITGDGLLQVSTYVAPIPGDINGDFTVNAIDAGIMFANWGTGTLESEGDIAGPPGAPPYDDTVNAIDAGVLFAHWTGDPGPSVSVPEPSSAVLLMGLAACCILCRREWRNVDNRYSEKGSNPMFRSAVIFQSVVIVLLAPAVLQAEFGDYRSIFVDRYDYPYTNGNIASMTSQINAMMEDAADQGFTEVVWQVRGRADALYHSNFEPDVNGLTPGFDPLQTALAAAHSRGLKLHAWLNSTPMWNTTAINPPGGHIYHNTNPSFRLEDINGNLEPQDGWSNYSSVNPILPEVHTHINNVVSDIATNYAVDGIHLDYIRYIPGGSNFDHFPHDSVSHQMFNQATGLDGSNPANFTAYKDYIKSRITDLVASIQTTVDTAEISTGRTMEYSASVWRDPDVGENSYMQDYRTWLENDYLDVVMPMIYLSASNDHLYFNDNLLNTLSISTNTRVAPTLASYLHVAGGAGGVDLTLSEIERAYLMGAGGVNFYDHPAYFNGYSAGDRQAIKDYLDFISDPPAGSPGTVIDDFETDQGHFDWSLTYSGSNQGILAGSMASRVTDEAESGNASQKLVIDGEPGGWFLRHLSGIGDAAAPSGNLALDATGYLGFWLKTADSGLSVQLALDDPGTADRGFVQNIVADNQWHLYQWNLEDDYQWEGWVTGDGDITGPAVTIDSIQFSGAGDATIYMDTVSYNTDQLLAAAAPGDFNIDGFVDEDDLAIWRAGFGTASGAGVAVGDADRDTDVDGSDFLVWQRNLTGAASATALAEVVPEPATWLLALLGTVLGPLGIRWTRPATVHRSV